jgi:hypothetical protein
MLSIPLTTDESLEEESQDSKNSDRQVKSRNTSKASKSTKISTIEALNESNTPYYDSSGNLIFSPYTVSRYLIGIPT